MHPNDPAGGRGLLCTVMRPMEIPEVLDARMQWLGACDSSAAKILAFEFESLKDRLDDEVRPLDQRLEHTLRAKSSVATRLDFRLARLPQAIPWPRRTRCAPCRV